MLVDKNAAFKNKRPEFELQTFYGQLTHIYRIVFLSAFPALEIDKGTTIIFAAIRSCAVTQDSALLDLDIHFYSKHGSLDLIDITSIQALVGRVPAGRKEWAIIDRSGDMARAEWLGDDEDNNNH